MILALPIAVYLRRAAESLKGKELTLVEVLEHFGSCKDKPIEGLQLESCEPDVTRDGSQVAVFTFSCGAKAVLLPEELSTLLVTLRGAKVVYDLGDLIPQKSFSFNKELLAPKPAFA